MKYLGIDYGTKKVGTALSDALGTIAFPKEVLKNDEQLLIKIQKIVEDEQVGTIVIGKSLNLTGEKNRVQQKIDQWKQELQEALGEQVRIEEQDERMSSFAANSFLFGKGNVSRERYGEKKRRAHQGDDDARAAAIILQRYLDRK